MSNTALYYVIFANIEPIKNKLSQIIPQHTSNFNTTDRVDIKTYTTNDRLVLKKSQTAWLQSDLVLISQKAPTPTKCTDPASNKQG